MPDIDGYAQSPRSARGWRWFAGAVVVGLLLPSLLSPSARAQDFAVNSHAYVVRFTAGATENLDGAPVLLRQPITLHLDHVTVDHALREVMARSGLKLSYSRTVVPLSKYVSVDILDGAVIEALRQVLQGSGVELWVSTTGKLALVPPAPSDEPASGEAQDVARLTGRITDVGGQPVRGAQVAIQTLNLRTLSTDDGRYTLAVPAANVHGQVVTVTVRFVGHSPASAQVTLRSGPISQDFVLQTVSVTLERLVITGTPGATRLKEIANSVGSIDVENKLENAPINSIQELFQGREPGLMSIGSDGELGTTNNIMLRGYNSLSQSNQPLIYVDGILINSGNIALVNLAGSSTSRLSDFNPQDIARVEIIKGASATTLYGSQASGGVIQIFTKRGSGTGTPQWSVHAEAGSDRMAKRFPYENPDHSLFSANDLITTGLLQNYDVSVRGTSGAVGYYTSLGYNQDNGSFPYNRYKKSGGRLNVTLQASPSLSLDLSSQYLWSNTNFPLNGYTSSGPVLAIEIGDPTKPSAGNPHGTYGYSETSLLTHENNESFNRFITGLTVNQILLPSLRHRLTVGLDAGTGTGVDYTPYGENYFPLGYKFLRLGQTTQANVDYAATWTASLPKDVMSTFSFGGQLNTVRNTTTGVNGRNYAIPSLDAIGGTSTQSNFEQRIHYTTAGYFGQEELGFGDRLFITAGMRIDASTAFGKNLSSQKYPKFGVSYVISDEPWFRLPAVSSLKLRTAWGKAGKLPGAFDAVRTYVAVPTLVGAGVVASSPGNPDLAPEITQEWEEGFDAGLWHDRVTLRVTAYQQHTDQAILSQPTPGSLGFTSASVGIPTAYLSNAGAIQNRGIEVGLDWTVLQRGRLQWELNATYAANASKILDLHGIPQIVTDPFGTQQRVGFPVSSKFAVVADGYTAAGVPTYKGVPTSTLVAWYQGPAVPPNNGALGSRVTFGSFALNTNAQWAQGGYTFFYTRHVQRLRATGEEYYATLAANGNNLTAPAVLAYLANPSGNWLFKSDFLKLREVTISYSLPAMMTGGRPTSVYLSGRNVLMWTSYPGVDPESSVTFGGPNGAGNNPGAGLSQGGEYGSTPQSRFLLVGTNISFGGGASR